VSDDLKDAGRAIRSKVNEVADRARAAGHDAKADTSDNPLERASERVKGGVDRAKAEYHEESADQAAEDAKH
jgi:hypothetical protein